MLNFKVFLIYKKMAKKNSNIEEEQNNDVIMINSDQFCLIKGLPGMYNFILSKKFGDSLKEEKDWEEILNEK